MLLQAGPITVWYESGFLRYINYGAAELLRMIYFALRDENWNTIDAVIENEDIRANTSSFSINYDCYHTKNDIAIYHWKAAISGDATGKITFEINGQALTGFQKNRLGFCVLHPIGNYEEQSVKITHSNGDVTLTGFPQYIANDSPFTDIRAFNWQRGLVSYQVSFEGDVFETEDQRNWADASFKTYCTPLSLPFPVKVNPYERCHQKIVFTPEVGKHALTPAQGSPVTIAIQNDAFPLPGIGVGASDDLRLLSETAVALLKKLNLDHYAVDIDPTAENRQQEFIHAYQQAKALGLPLAIKLHLSDDFVNELTAFTTLCTQYHDIVIKSILLLSKGENVTSQSLINYAHRLKAVFPETQIGAGTDFNFTEINRHRFDAADLDFIGYASHPQEHASDDLTLIENIAAIAETVKSTKNIYGENMPVYISPVTLKKRFNPYATHPGGVVKSSAERCDQRQTLALCALFTLGSIKSLAISKATSVTFFQAVGEQGIISINDESYPVYDALKLIAGTPEGTSVIHTTSSAPLVVDSLLLDNNKLLIWNYTTENQPVLLPGEVEVNVGPHQVLALNLPL